MTASFHLPDSEDSFNIELRLRDRKEKSENAGSELGYSQLCYNPYLVVLLLEMESHL
jgi:hypothetical protein